MKVAGRVWVFGDHVNTDLLLPVPALALPPAERPAHVFASNRPGWAATVARGDVIVAGVDFGTGSGRPAAQVLKDLGIGCLLAESINGLFFRNCVNHAFPALEVPGVATAFADGDEAEIDFERAVVRNRRTGQTLWGEPWPRMLAEVLEAGGVIALLEREDLLLPAPPDRRRKHD